MSGLSPTWRDELQLSITLYNSRTNTNGRTRTLCWNQLKSELSRHRVRETKDGHLWSPVTLKPEKPNRLNENVEWTYLAVGDVDDYSDPDELLYSLQEAGLEYIAYTSHSYQPDLPKYRLALPLLHRVPASDHAALWRGFVAAYGRGHLDPQCSDCSRAFYWPSVPPKRLREGVWEPWSRSFEGMPLDPGPLIAAAPPIVAVVRAPLPPFPLNGHRPDARIILAHSLASTEGKARHYRGYHLARQLQANNYDEAEAEPVVLDLQRQIEAGEHPYTEKEALDSLHAAYLKSPLAPWPDKLLPARPAPSAARPNDKLPAAPTPTRDDGIVGRWAAAADGRFLFAEGDEWWEYDKTCWHPVSDSTIDGHINAWLLKQPEEKKRVSARLIREIRFLASLSLGRDDRPFPRVDFNADRNKLPLANGMLDVTTREIVAHQHSDFNTYCLPYDYEAGATCSRFTQFLSETMLRGDGQTCPEWVAALEEWMGYCLIPDSHAETVLVNVGEGGNGKSVWTKVLEGLVGDVNCAVIEPRQLELKPEYEIAHLYGKLVGFLSEPTRTQLAGCSGHLKRLASGDPVEGRHPHGRVFTYRPHVRLVISCNEIPDTKDLTHGYFRKLTIVEWRFRPPNPDRGLDRKLLAEMPGILNLALAGLDRLRARDYDFGEPSESKLLKADYRFAQDSVAQFLADACIADPDREDIWCDPSELHKGYAEWCKRTGYAALNIAAFGNHLTRRLGYHPKRSKRFGEGVADVRFGIQLRALPFRGREEYLL